MSRTLELGGLWPARSGNGWTGRVDPKWKEPGQQPKPATPAEIMDCMTEGWTFGLFTNTSGNDRAPSHRLVLLPPREQSQGARDNRDWQAPRDGSGQMTRPSNEQRSQQGFGRSAPRQSLADELSDDVPFAPCVEV